MLMFRSFTPLYLLRQPVNGWVGEEKRMRRKQPILSGESERTSLWMKENEQINTKKAVFLSKNRNLPYYWYIFAAESAVSLHRQTERMTNKTVNTINKNTKI